MLWVSGSSNAFLSKSYQQVESVNPIKVTGGGVRNDSQLKVVYGLYRNSCHATISMQYDDDRHDLPTANEQKTNTCFTWE